MTIPGLWLFGGKDKEVPSAQSAAVIERLKGDGKDFSAVVYPGAGHGLFDVPPTDPKALPTAIAWIREQLRKR